MNQLSRLNPAVGGGLGGLPTRSATATSSAVAIGSYVAPYVIPYSNSSFDTFMLKGNFIYRTDDVGGSNYSEGTIASKINKATLEAERIFKIYSGNNFQDTAIAVSDNEQYICIAGSKSSSATGAVAPSIAVYDTLNKVFLKAGFYTIDTLSSTYLDSVSVFDDGSVTCSFNYQGNVYGNLVHIPDLNLTVPTTSKKPDSTRRIEDMKTYNSELYFSAGNTIYKTDKTVANADKLQFQVAGGGLDIRFNITQNGTILLAQTGYTSVATEEQVFFCKVNSTFNGGISKYYHKVGADYGSMSFLEVSDNYVVCVAVDTINSNQTLIILDNNLNLIKAIRTTGSFYELEVDNENIYLLLATVTMAASMFVVPIADLTADWLNINTGYAAYSDDGGSMTNYTATYSATTAAVLGGDAPIDYSSAKPSAVALLNKGVQL